jgi:hypothetical protein
MQSKSAAVIYRLEDPTIIEAAGVVRDFFHKGKDGLTRDELDEVFEIIEANVDAVYYFQVLHEYPNDLEVIFALWKCCHAILTVLYSLKGDDSRAHYSMEIIPIYKRCETILRSQPEMNQQFTQYAKTFPMTEQEMVDITDDEQPSKAQKTE